MPSFPRRALGVALTGSTVAFGLALASPAAAAQAGAGDLVRLQHDVVVNLSRIAPASAVPASMHMTVGLSLQRPDPQGEAAYQRALYDKHSPLFHDFLSPQAFAMRFGVSGRTFVAAQQWLGSTGLTVQTVPGVGDYLEASGTAAQVERLFGVHENEYDAKRHFYANAENPLVPADLHVRTVLGLNNLTQWRTAAATSRAKALPNTGLLSPQDLWSVYDQPASDQGEGQSMAVFGWGDPGATLTNLPAFENEFRLPHVPTSVQFYGDSSTPNDPTNGNDGEWSIDTQASTGMAPGAAGETLFFARHGTDADLEAAFAAWAEGVNTPQQANASFGGCESTVGGDALLLNDQGYEDTTHGILRQAVLEGKTLFASTGDTGSSCPALWELSCIAPVVSADTCGTADTNGLATQADPALGYPAADPDAVAVGGTIIGTDGGSPAQRVYENAWEFGGGGNSTAIPAGDYQQGVTAIAARCVSDMDGQPLTPDPSNPPPLCRATPDVSSLSGDVALTNGMTVFSGGANGQGAGTSLSSPLWMGMWARIQAAAPVNPRTGTYTGLGFANETLYDVGKNHNADFYDVVVGDNQPYPALPGWDNATGWGTPYVAKIMQDVDGGLVPTNPSAAGPVFPVTFNPCGALFSSAPHTVVYNVTEGGQSVQPDGTGDQPQLNIVKGTMSDDGKTLKTVITLKNLTATVPTGGGENDYNFLFSYNGVQYFTQVEVVAGSDLATPVVHYFDGQLVRVAIESKYLQENVDQGAFTPGPNGTVEVDAPLSDFGTPPTGADLQQPAAVSYVREGVTNGVLEPVDSQGPTYDYQVGQSCAGADLPEAPVQPLLVLSGIAGAATVWAVVRRRRSARAV